VLQKEERIIIVLLSISLAVLSIAYLFLSAGSTAEYSNNSRIGEQVYASGIVTAKQPTRSGENLILELNSNSIKIKVFIPKSASAGELAKKIKIGDRVRVRGTLQEYKGEREVVIREAKDVSIARAN